MKKDICENIFLLVSFFISFSFIHGFLKIFQSVFVTYSRSFFRLFFFFICITFFIWYYSLNILYSPLIKRLLFNFFLSISFTSRSFFFLYFHFFFFISITFLFFFLFLLFQGSFCRSFFLYSYHFLIWNVYLNIHNSLNSQHSPLPQYSSFISSLSLFSFFIHITLLL